MCEWIRLGDESNIQVEVHPRYIYYPDSLFAMNTTSQNATNNSLWN